MITWALPLPALAALVWMYLRSPSRALIDIYLPVFLLFPLYYVWRVKGIPPFDVQQWMMIAFALFILSRHAREIFFSRADLWITLFVYCGAISEILRYGLRAGVFELAGDITSVLLPYFVAKLLIEQHDMRAETLRRICILLFIVSLGSVYEFTQAINPYHAHIDAWFGGQGWEWANVQMRWGMARIAGPYAHAIHAGMMIFAGALFNLWLIRTRAWDQSFLWLRLPRWLNRGWLITYGLFFGLFMTQSRGPWIATPFGFIMTAVGLARNPRRTLIQVVFATAVIAAIVYPFVQSYTTGAVWQPSDQDRQNAIYRRALIDNYTPVVERGGAWGWGTFFPVVANQGSIDNEFLLLALQRGYIGLGLFLILCADSLYHLILVGVRSRSRSDRIFSFSLIGVIAGFLFSIVTVFLGLHVYTFFFFVLGWGQAIGRTRKVYRPLFHDFYDAQLQTQRDERTAVLQ